jgi:hypothetical protein
MFNDMFQEVCHICKIELPDKHTVGLLYSVFSRLWQEVLEDSKAKRQIQVYVYSNIQSHTTGYIRYFSYWRLASAPKMSHHQATNRNCKLEISIYYRWRSPTLHRWIHYKCM